MEVVSEDCARSEIVRRAVETKTQDGLLQLGETTRLLAGLLPELGGNRSIVSGELVLRRGGKLCEDGRCSKAPELLNGVLGGSSALQQHFEVQFCRVVSQALVSKGLRVEAEDVSVIALRVDEAGELAVEYEVR